ncbi:MAG: pilus assembly protein PilP, partial [Thermoanaerobaculia bacterium]|nr:pilus assembly protein PilP [Thermoanaerobaculia bacterium]
MSAANPSSPRAALCAASRAALLAAAALALSGCVEQDMSDLRAYAQEVLSRKGTRIDELPPVEPYEVYSYSSSDGVDPFEPFYKEEAPQPGEALAATDSGIRPNFDRNREELENYSLDSLRMMGTLELDEELWGIVRSPDGTIHRVQVGNYLGRNHGKIVSISEESIDLNEI